MNRLWSPWRSQHVTAFNAAHQPASGQHISDPHASDPHAVEDTDSRSVFSRMAGEDRDADNLIVWRGAQVFVVMNLYPYNNGHLLIVPYRQVATYAALTPAERHAIADATDLCMRWLTDALHPEGFNVGMNEGAAGGAGIPDHLHVHVLPRWAGDTNFMPTLADVKVIPEAMQVTYQKLLDAVAKEV